MDVGDCNAAFLSIITGGQVLTNSGVRQPFQRVASAPPPTSTQSPHQVPGPAQPMTRPVRPQGDPGMHPGEYDTFKYNLIVFWQLFCFVSHL